MILSSLREVNEKDVNHCIRTTFLENILYPASFFDFYVCECSDGSSCFNCGVDDRKEYHSHNMHCDKNRTCQSCKKKINTHPTHVYGWSGFYQRRYNQEPDNENLLRLKLVLLNLYVFLTMIFLAPVNLLKWILLLVNAVSSGVLDFALNNAQFSHYINNHYNQRSYRNYDHGIYNNRAHYSSYPNYTYCGLNNHRYDEYCQKCFVLLSVKSFESHEWGSMNVFNKLWTLFAHITWTACGDVVYCMTSNGVTVGMYFLMLLIKSIVVVILSNLLSSYGLSFVLSVLVSLTLTSLVVVNYNYNLAVYGILLSITPISRIPVLIAILTSFMSDYFYSALNTFLQIHILNSCCEPYSVTYRPRYSDENFYTYSVTNRATVVNFVNTYNLLFKIITIPFAFAFHVFGGCLNILLVFLTGMYLKLELFDLIGRFEDHLFNTKPNNFHLFYAYVVESCTSFLHSVFSNTKCAVKYFFATLFIQSNIVLVRMYLRVREVISRETYIFVTKTLFLVDKTFKTLYRTVNVAFRNKKVKTR
ncbi:hypothetical protein YASMINEVIRUS_1314 [Yasminevirus sp. GU-2018]|uniref:Uncharacterized protein n=1 Tax=Yasminevirus sp. GU-2018 TaxID=2420051 RepID=A0A5K0UB26_9VIRU|nr:hypothetical protein YASMINEVIRUS_1314 [Yasminevirus sp. GU-2018]